MKEGTLVSVKASPTSLGDRSAVRDHGYLWTYVGDISKNMQPLTRNNYDVLRTYKALATGELFCWFDTQVDVAS